MRASTFRPRLWAAADATWATSGGGATVDGGEPAGSMNNTRLGATVSFPMSRQQSLKFSYSSGVRGPDRDEFQNAQRGMAVAPVHKTIGSAS